MSMQVALVNSLQDEAGVNIRNNIRQILQTFRRRDVAWRLHEVDGRLIVQDHLDADLSTDLIIFLSRHRSENPLPVLTVHVTGNFHEAVFGGRPRSLATAAPGWMQAVLRNLAASAPPPYRVSYEVTHHGPTELETPSFFVEIGSTPLEWNDPSAGRAVASSVLAAKPQDPVPLIGFGGTHYAARETMIALQSRGAFGHIAHSRESSRIDLTQIQAMQVRSQAVAAYIDKKSIAPADYHNLRALLRGAGIPEIGESELLSLGELDFSTYLTLRKKAEILSHGSAVHPHHLSGSGVPVIAEIPGDLLDEAVRVDEKAASDMIRSLPAAHITGSDGKLLPVFFTFEEHRSALINHLITFCVKLISGCANTAVEGDRLIICRTRFDPRKARDLGIPREQFGRLAGGQAIEMNGTIITPVMVQTGSVKEIHIPGLARYL